MSGYYDWCQRKPSAHEREDGDLAKQIHRIFHEHWQVYGSPRVHAVLRAQGVRCSRQRVARLMREMELAAKGREVLQQFLVIALAYTNMLMYSYER